MGKREKKKKKRRKNYTKHHWISLPSYGGFFFIFFNMLTKLWSLECIRNTLPHP